MCPISMVIRKRKKKWMTAIGRGKNVKHFMPEERLAYYNKTIVEECSQITLTQNGTYLSEKYLELVDLVADFFEQICGQF